MQLSNCELIPGVISDTKDPLKLGRIKCVIPGYVDASFSNENMPWVRPLGMIRHQSFSKMMPGYKVWILVNKSNYNEYWYFPFFEFNDVAKNFLEGSYDNDQPEIFMAHNCGGNHAVSGYDENNGFTTKIGEHHIDLHPDGHVSIIGGQHEVDINGSVNVGAKGGGYDQQAVLGNILVKILTDLKGAMSNLQGKSTGIHACFADGFTKAVTALNQADNILSKNVYLN